MTTSSGAFVALDLSAAREGPGRLSERVSTRVADWRRTVGDTIGRRETGRRERTTSTEPHEITAESEADLVADLAAARDRADLEAARRGDDHAARRLLRRHGDGMRRTARRVLAGSADADDAVQDALVAALVTDALPRGDVGAWLRAVAARKAIDRCRQTARRGETAGEDAPDPATDDPATLERLLVHQALRRLSPIDRAVLVLMDLEGRSSAEIARHLGSTRAAVKVRAVRARRKLAAILRDLPESASSQRAKETDDG